MSCPKIIPSHFCPEPASPNPYPAPLDNHHSTFNRFRLLAIFYNFTKWNQTVYILCLASFTQ